ncbi:MAG: hypothetical protein Q9206_005207 [Seirophora lacunosa]
MRLDVRELRDNEQNDIEDHHLQTVLLFPLTPEVKLHQPQPQREETTLHPSNTMTSKEKTRSTKTGDSPQKRTALALVDSFNRMDVPAIVSARTPACLRHLYPTAMAQAPQDTAAYTRSLTGLRTIFRNFTLTVDELIEDAGGQRICMWLSARADTEAGEYVNEYVWLLDFDEGGRKIVRTKEYSDSVMARDFFPKLRAAMETKKGGQGGAKAR